MSFPLRCPSLAWSCELPVVEHRRVVLLDDCMVELVHDATALRLRALDLTSGRERWPHLSRRASWASMCAVDARSIVMIAGTTPLVHLRITADGELAETDVTPHARYGTVTADGDGRHVIEHWDELGRIVELRDPDGALVWRDRAKLVAAGTGCAITQAHDSTLVCRRGAQDVWRAPPARYPIGAEVIAGDHLFVKDTWIYDEWSEIPDEDEQAAPEIGIAAIALADGRERWYAAFRHRRGWDDWWFARDDVGISYEGVLYPVAVSDGAKLPPIELASGERVRIHAGCAGHVLWSTRETIGCTALASGEPLWTMPPPGIDSFTIHSNADVLVIVHAHSLHVLKGAAY